MRSYSKVERFLWRDPRFRTLGDDAQKLWLYFLTCPTSTTCPGLFMATPMTIIDELCWADAEAEAFAVVLPEAVRRLSAATRALCAAGWMEYDARTRVVYVLRALEHNMPESPNVVRSWATALKSIPPCEVRGRWIAAAYATLRDEGHASLARVMREALDKVSIEINESITHGQSKPKTRAKSLGNLSQESCLNEAKNLALEEGYLSQPTCPGEGMPLSFRLSSLSQESCLNEAKSLGLANQEQEQEQEQDQDLASAAAECEPTPLSHGTAPEEPETETRKATTYHEYAEPLARFMEQRIIEEKPDTRRPTEATFNGWVRDMHRIIAIDKRAPERVRDIIDWATRDNFWAANVRSPAKLRMQFDRLEVEVDRRGKREASKTPRQREETNPDRALGYYQDLDEKMRRAGIDLGGER
jgi:hypothetical protein